MSKGKNLTIISAISNKNGYLGHYFVEGSCKSINFLEFLNELILFYKLYMRKKLFLY